MNNRIRQLLTSITTLENELAAVLQAQFARMRADLASGNNCSDGPGYGNDR